MQGSKIFEKIMKNVTLPAGTWTLSFLEDVNINLMNLTNSEEITALISKILLQIGSNDTPPGYKFKLAQLLSNFKSLNSPAINSSFLKNEKLVFKIQREISDDIKFSTPTKQLLSNLYAHKLIQSPSSNLSELRWKSSKEYNENLEKKLIIQSNSVNIHISNDIRNYRNSMSFPNMKMKS